MEFKEFKTKIGEDELSVGIGKLALQSSGSVTVRRGDTVILATCTMSGNTREGIDYLPLMVDYEEKLYAAGKIKGSRFIKREGRASETAMLNGRMIDRTIRPLFDSRIRKDIQVVITVLSFDKVNSPTILGLIGASIALSISDIPWNGPIGSTLIADSDVIISGTKEKINMIDASLSETKEEEVVKMLETASKEIKELVSFQETIIKELKPVKKELELKEVDKELEKEVESFTKGKLETAMFQADKIKRTADLDKLEEELKAHLIEKDAENEDKIQEALNILEEKINESVHQNAIENEKRIDGRKLDEVREISGEIGLLPRTHGSALFNRGTTQALSVVTLGPPGAEQLLDELENEGKKGFMHHYNFPPFSVGEVRPMRGPGRREIGHGALAEKALLPLIPSRDDFPYTIRIVSEILSSNGSSSMASVCGSTLALLDAGVPMKSNAAGIAMGLMTDGEKYKILTDIQGPEDHHGDMDLKVAGTREGITALQMDVKVDGVSLKVLTEALTQAKQAREGILDKMEAVIKAPREDLSTFAPRIYTVKINPDKIGTVIGPGGKMIHKITEETGVEIDIDDDGTVFITSPDSEGADKAVTWVKELTKELKIGEVIQGKIVKIADFGAFVQLAPGQDGLLHISEILTGPNKGKELRDVIKEGGTITVKIKNIDDKGKVSLVLFKEGILM